MKIITTSVYKKYIINYQFILPNQKYTIKLINMWFGYFYFSAPSHENFGFIKIN
jgi:hypothetical protein